MILELSKQCTSLELSKRLKELGAPQESLYYWCTDLGEITYSKTCEHFRKANCGGHTAAYTVAELLDLMPPGRKVYKFTEFKDVENAYMCEQSGDYEDSDTAANACAKLLISLLEQKLITL